MKKILLSIFVALTVFCATGYGQGTKSNWMPPPVPDWFIELSKTEKEALIQMGMSSSITCIIVPPGWVRLEAREIIKQYKCAWAYNEDDPNIFSLLSRAPNGQYVQVMISRYWLNNLR